MLQHALSQSKMALSDFESVLDRVMSLINDSDRKDHIYREAGDLIFRAHSLIEQAKEGVDVASYWASKSQYRDLENKIPADLKEEIDSILKHSHPEETPERRVARKFLRRRSDYPDGGPNDWIGKDEPGQDQAADDYMMPGGVTKERDYEDESIYDVEYADDLLKHQEEPRDQTRHIERLEPMGVGDGDDRQLDDEDKLFHIDDNIRFH